MWNSRKALSFMLILKQFCEACDCESHKVMYTKNFAVEQKGISENIVKTVTDTVTATGKENYDATEAPSHIEYKEEDLYETLCPYFHKVSNYGYDKMADVWQTTFYKNNEDVACFKIYITKLTPEEQHYAEQMYGDFNHTVDWNNSIFEINSNDNHLIEKNFLFEDSNNVGVFDNIVIVADTDRNTSRFYLQEENVNQWMVFHNLLLMRDCNTGDIVVFARYPHSPKLEDIYDALKAFGEDNLHGNHACVDEKIHNPEINNYVSENHFYIRNIKKVLRDVYNKLVTFAS